ncbi:MAG TPA: hypothetical protein VF657_14875 [Actinoplanes sp.]
MNAADKVLLRLADPAARAGLLNADALLELATVCYEIDPATVAGPTTAAYDRVDLAVPLAPERSATARAMRAGDAMPWDLLVTWDAGSEPAPGADAVVVAHLAVRAAGAGGVIDEVDVTAPVPVPGPSGDGRETLGLRLHMSALPDPAGAAPLVLPVVIAFLVADGAAAPRELLRATAAARRAARPYPVPELPSNSPPRRTERCVCWLVPAAAFDDDGWPGGTGGNADVQRSARLAAARGWLATQGIAVVTT